MKKFKNYFWEGVDFLCVLILYFLNYLQIVAKLEEYPKMKFIWAEISYLSMW